MRYGIGFLEHQMEKTVAHEMETGMLERVYSDNSEYHDSRFLVYVWNRVPQINPKYPAAIV